MTYSKSRSVQTGVCSVNLSFFGWKFPKENIKNCLYSHVLHKILMGMWAFTFRQNNILNGDTASDSSVNIQALCSDERHMYSYKEESQPACIQSDSRPYIYLSAD